MEEELLVPHAGWLPLEHAQPFGEVFSNAVQPAHTQATAPGVPGQGESNALCLPSLPAAELGWHLGPCLLMVTSDVCGVRVWPRVKMPLLQMGKLQGLHGSNAKAWFVSLEHHYLCCNITEAWQMPLSAPSPNGNIEQLSSSCLSPRKSVQKLMAQDISYSCVASSPELLC